MYWSNISATIAEVFATIQSLPFPINELEKVPSIGCNLADRIDFCKRFVIQFTTLLHSDIRLNLNKWTASVFTWSALIIQDYNQSEAHSLLLRLAFFEGLLIVLLLALTARFAQTASLEQQQSKVSKKEIEREIAQHQQAQKRLTDSQTRSKLINSILIGIMSGISIEQITERLVKQISEYFSTLQITYSNINDQGNITVIHSVKFQGVPQLQKSVMNLTAVPECLGALLMSPLIIEDVAQDSRLASLADTIKAFGVQALLSVPFQHPDKLVGLLCFESPQPQRWSEHEITTLIGIAQYLSILIKDAHAQQEQQRAESALQESNLRMRLALEAAHMDSWDWDVLSGKVTYSTNTETNLLALRSFDGTYNSFLASVHPEDQELVAQKLSCAMELGAGYDIEFRVIRPDRSVCWVASKGQIYCDQAGQAMRLFGVNMDITSRKQTELVLRQMNEERWRSQKMLQLVMDLIPQSIWWKDRDSRFLGCNRNFAQMTGVRTPENLVSKTDYDVWSKEEADCFRSIDQRVMAQNQAEYCIVESVQQPDGTLTWLETNKIPLHDEEGRVIGTMGTSQDITERKQAEEQIKASLQEKEVLLKEVHHRVKNNLQVIDSLFRHQRRNTKDEQTNEILKECQNRVNSMALLHEKLYQSTDLSKIAFAEYVRSLVANLFDSYTISSSTPTLKLNISNIFLDIEKALPCGLIVNELVSNSLKYAFTPGNLGEIYVEFDSTDTQNYTLIVKDNGVGLPENVDFSNLQTLGLKLVKSLVRQLKGIIEIDCSKGTEFQITFSEAKDHVKN